MIWGVYSREVRYFIFSSTKRVRGNKTGPIDYIEHPVPLFGGEFSKEESYVSKGGPLGGYRDSLDYQFIYGPNTGDWNDILF